MKKWLFAILLIGIAFNSCSIFTKKSQQPVFVDDFSSGTSSNWTSENHTFENNLAHFSAKNISTVDNKLVLTLTKQPNQGKAYAGAEIRSATKYLYGRFEAKLKATQTLGCITAFFLYQPAGKQNQEIDFEISGKFPNQITLNHWVDKKSHDKDIELPFNTTSAFHDYVIVWEPKKITWLIDGVTVYSTTEAVPNKPMHVIFNLWATKSTNWAGQIAEAKLPATAYIDDVKFYPYKN